MKLLQNELDILRKENRLRKAYISQAGQDSIKRMIEYVGTLKLKMFELAVLEKDLIGMALEAEQGGETLESRIGNPKNFCDSLTQGNSKTQVGEMLLFQIKNALGATAVLYGMMYAFSRFAFKMHFSITYLIFVLFWWLFCGIMEIMVNSTYWDEKKRTFLNLLVFGGVLSLYLWFNLSFSTAYGITPDTFTFYTYGFLPMAVFGLLWVAARLLFNRYIHGQAQQYNWQN